jgi:hypothetical protein
MGNRRPERTSGGPLGVRMDPLRIVGCRSEGVDALLCYLAPFGRAELDADEVGEPAQAGPQRSAVAAQV